MNHYESCINNICSWWPSCGKSTVCNRLFDRYKITHISVGKLLIRKMEKKSDLGNIILQYVKSGEIVPAKMIFDILMNELSKCNDTVLGLRDLLIDGYPRNYCSEQSQ